MEAPREVFILEHVSGAIMVHSTKGPMVFVELEDIRKMVEGDAKAEKFGDKWSVARIPMNKELGSQPFRFYDVKKCDTQKIFPNAIYLADLRDMVAQGQTPKTVAYVDGTEAIPTGDISKLGGLSLDPDEERIELRAKLRKLQVNPRNVRDLEKLRAMLAEAQTVSV